MHEEVRAVLSTLPRLAGVVDTLPVDADLWSAGMDSLTSVHVMVRLEDHFALQFTEDALTRDTFGSINAIAAAVAAVVASREGGSR
jgi:acyl carrier protein